MAEQLEVSVRLMNDKVQFSGNARSNPAVAFDYQPPLGDGQGYTGLEMLLMSFAACSGTAMAVLLRKSKKHITGLEVNATGIRKAQPPFSFEKITVEFVVNSRDAEDSDIQKALQLSEESMCPVWAMIKNNVEIEARFRKAES